MTRKGFTLIELLVVIAIIAILAAILFPVFARARDKARQTTCASNLKQIALAVVQYEQDYDELLPIVASRNCVPVSQLVAAPLQSQVAASNSPGADCVANAGVDYTWGWMECIYPYVKSKAVFSCPSDAARSALGESNTATQTIASYGMNRYLGWWAGTGNYTWGTGDAVCAANFGSYYCGDSGYPTSKIQRPTDIVMLSEYAQTSNFSSNKGIWDFLIRYYTIGVDSNDGNWFNCVSGDYMANAGFGINVWSNHSGFTNVAFIDGHVKAIPIKGNLTAPAVDNTWLMAPCNEGDSTNAALDTHWHPDK